jgi:hypothetical protein
MATAKINTNTNFKLKAMTKVSITNPLTSETKEKIVLTVENYIENRKGTAGFLVDNFLKSVEGVNKTDWSYMRNRNWDKVRTVRSGKEVLSSVKDIKFLNLGRAVGLEFEGDYWQHFNTDNYMMICNVISEARTRKIPYCIDGDTGQGKTYSISRYHQERSADTFVVRCAGDMSVKDFIVEVAEAVGCEAVGSKVQVRKRIVRHLSKKNDPVLIIDEAENLKDGAYDGIKAMMDDLKGICPIVIVGANDYQSKLQKLAEKKKKSFPQIYSRLKEGGFNRLFEMGREDVSGICNALNIKDKSLIGLLANYCSNMRELSGTITTLLKEADQAGRPVDSALFKAII